ncbi:DEAD/DEAH box helicase family protein [Roseomonas mucosa]|uniref:DEAD/DEAH box helicase family protein n=1 Tax=Roseomonas mucosa TaxID=207340 RepID=UPI0030CD5DA0
MLSLRYYQEAAVDAVWDGMAKHDGNLLAVLPTGTGKALCICELVRRALQGYPETRILVLTHSRELVEQNYLEMKRLWPEVNAGIYSAGLKRRDTRHNVIFGSIQSIHNKAYQIQTCDLLIVDEAQGIPNNSDAMWRKFLDQLQSINGGRVRVIGWTATPFRLQSGMLHKGKNALFDHIVYEYGMLDAIKDGFIVRPISKKAETQIDTSNVGTRGGEFIASQLEAAATHPDVVDAVAEEIIANGQDRRSWIVFGCGVKHCEMLREAIRERGYSCEGVFATTPLEERDQIIAAFKRQEIRALVSVTALTVGFNAPATDLVALARPTQSPGLYIQAVGRGTRLCPGKSDCLVLDFGNHAARLGPLDKPRIKGERASTMKDGMPMKVCLSCDAKNAIAARECVECGAPFPPIVQQISMQASTMGLLSEDQAKPQWVPVMSVQYRRHEKPGKPPSMRIIYSCGLVQHSEWQCPEHAGYAREKFVQWWRKRAPDVPVPDTVAQALAQSHVLKRPTQIAVRPEGKFTAIVGSIL